MVLSCNGISKAFADKQILSNVSFHINDREKAAIIGINGAGKSTLLKIIVGEMEADSGTVITGKDISIGYLAQHQNVSGKNTIFDELLEVKKDLLDIENKIRQIELDMKSASDEELESMCKTYSNLTHQFELANGYAYKSEVTGVLKGLGFSEEDFTKTIDTLSGGQKTRVALGRLLLTKPELIILDEPTNHLDINSIAWLENYLSNYSGAVLIVAHDRYFLDKIVTKVVGLENGNASMYEGNYSDFAVKAASIRESQIKQYLNQQKEIKHQEEVIEKLRSFNREKSVKRADSRQKALDKIVRLEKPLELDNKMRIKFQTKIESGNDVLDVQNISKSFGSNKLFEDVSFDIKKGEKVAIIGDNGTGKTTILKILNELVSLDEGKIKFGAKVVTGYYDQEHQLLNLENNLFEEIADEYPQMTNTEIRNLLAAFLFTNDDVFKLIRDLSGGEKGRLALAKLMLSNANFLMLDEPTNHLDITSKEILEDSLINYPGTVLFVSHDRYFINKVSTRILDLTQGKLVNYIGNYDYYLEKKDEVEKAFFASNNPGVIIEETKKDDSNSKLEWKQMKEQQALKRKKENDLKKVEDRISKLEEESSGIDELLQDESIASDVSKLMELSDKKEKIDAELEELMELWASFYE